jgi:hypothetical protein
LANDFIISIASNGFITNAAVDRASARKAVRENTVTDTVDCAGYPVFGFRIW